MINFFLTIVLRLTEAFPADLPQLSGIKAIHLGWDPLNPKQAGDDLYRERYTLASFGPEVMERMIIRCAELHIEHIGKNGDPFEFGSSRPLDFGHWSAHKIEELTGGAVRHGEAVAMGIALDALYSHHSGLLSQMELRKIMTILEDIGFELYHWAVGWIDIDKALREFQEHLGGKLTIILLNGIGQKTEVNKVGAGSYRTCIDILASRRSKNRCFIEVKDEKRKEPNVGQRNIGQHLP